MPHSTDHPHTIPPNDVPPSDGLVSAYLLDGSGTGRTIGWTEIRQWTPGRGLIWIHLDYTSPDSRRWLMQDSGLDAVSCEVLLVEESRPRCVAVHDGLLLIFRGVNLNPGSEPDDMISIRLWIDAQRIVTLRRRRLMAVQDVRDALQHGSGPRDAGSFLVELSDRLSLRMNDVVAELDDRVDALEDQVLAAESYALRPQLAEIRRQAIGLRRYLAPQRDIMTRLQLEKIPWLDEPGRIRLREIADRTTRYLEDLDSARERAAVTQEELNSRLAEQMNERMYVLALVTVIFLPLGLITGLLGINVAGIPGAENGAAFVIVCALLLSLGGGLLLFLKRKGWF